MINFGIIFKWVGILSIIAGCMMLMALPFSFYHHSGDELSISLSAIASIVTGILIWRACKNVIATIGKREGYLIVAIGWIFMSFVCTLPYLMSGVFQNFTNAFFESVSGLTTTGASVLNDIESLPHGVLFWRSLTQWVGGMGIIVLTVAILPLLGIGGVELFVAEAPGPQSDKIHPRIREAAKRLWIIYVLLTILLIALLKWFGMTFFDAINHGLTTMATGGFSTKNSSIAYFASPLIQYTIILFMFIAGTNYTILYFGFKGQIKKVLKSQEFKTYIGLVVTLILFVSIIIYCTIDVSPEKAFRDAAFQIISIITTTGFVTADYTSWGAGLALIFLILMFVGGSAGSTSGGIKIVRHLVLVKNSFLEFKRLLHPSAVIRLKVDGKIVPNSVLTQVLVFLLLYLMIFVFGSVVMSFVLIDFEQPILSAIGSVATSLGNVGPGIGNVGPLDNFSAIPDFGKWFLALLMILGRLELFTILILFMPYFWRTN